MPEYGLAIHTASPDVGLAISNFTADPRQQVWNLGRDASNFLHVYLAEFLQPQTWTDIAFIAVAKGPGGFTGTRLGVVTARTLAQQLEIPLFAISTLAAIAWQHRLSAPSSTNLAIRMRAQRGEVFGAIYTPTASGLCNVLLDTVLPPEQWQQQLDRQTVPYTLIEAEGGFGQSVSSVLELAHSEWQQGKRPLWSEALPFYGQHPVVER